jgi:hypothetical protein
VDKSTRKRKRRRDNPDGGPRVLKIFDDLGDLTSGLLLDGTDESEAATRESVVLIAL